MKKITRIGIGGPVGSGKTAVIETITPRLIALGIKPLIITNDVVTTEDAKQVRRTRFIRTFGAERWFGR